jgi:DNA-binding CsgD family transcriptional regulator
MIGGLGSFEWHPESGELLWSDNLYRLYGYTPGAVTPTVERFLSHVHPDDLARVSEAVGERRLEGLRTRFVRDDGTVVRFEVVMEQAEDGERLFGCLRDITEQQRAESEIAAYVAVSEVLEHWTSVDESAPELLSRLAVSFDARFAVLWVPDEDELVVRSTWVPEGDTVARAAMDAAIAGRGRSLAAAAWRRGSPGVTHLSQAPRTSVAIPVPYADEVLAVVRLQAEDHIEPTERLMRTLTGIGHELGHFLNRRRGELHAGPLSARETEVLQLAADGHSGRAIAARLEISPATVKRHFESIYGRLGVADRAAAVAEAMRRGLVE